MNSAICVCMSVCTCCGRSGAMSTSTHTALHLVPADSSFPCQPCQVLGASAHFELPCAGLSGLWRTAWRHCCSCADPRSSAAVSLNLALHAAVGVGSNSDDVTTTQQPECSSAAEKQLSAVDVCSECVAKETIQPAPDASPLQEFLQIWFGPQSGRGHRSGLPHRGAPVIPDQPQHSLVHE